MKTRKLMSKLYRIFPRTLAESWDHVGLMIGPAKEETNTVALCLDLDAESLAKAIDGGADMVISHHPVFFGRKKDILLSNAERLNVFEKATEAGIVAYSFHTNFDAKFPEGMNEALAEKLGLSEIHPLVSEPMAVGGELPAPMEVHEPTMDMMSSWSSRSSIFSSSWSISMMLCSCLLSILARWVPTSPAPAITMFIFFKSCLRGQSKSL